MSKHLRVVIADDMELFLNGLALLLDKEGFEVAGKARNGLELLDVTQSTQPDIVITDIGMPKLDGIEATRKLRSGGFLPGIIALTVHDCEDLVVDMLDAGANGYLSKSICMDQLNTAVKGVHQGFSYFCNGTSLRLTEKIATGNHHLFKNESVQLSYVESQIVQMICQQLTNKEIADKTRLKTSTVEKYRTRIMEKLGAQNAVGIAIYAIRHGLFKL